MFSFFKNKKYPTYWKNYIDKVENCEKYSNLDDIRFVALDTETTGFDYENDRMLSIGAIAIKGNKIMVSDSFEVYIKQDVFNKETIKIHGIRRNGTEKKVSEEEALIEFLEYLDDAVIVAHHTSFDVTMINCGLKRLNIGPLISKQLDTNYIYKKIMCPNQFKKIFSLDELCTIYNITMHDRHTASGDALLTSQLFLKLLAKYKKNYGSNLNNLIQTNYNLSR